MRRPDSLGHASIASRVCAACFGFALLALSTGAAQAQVITEFSAGITAGAGLRGITAGPDGNLWFTEYSGNRIGRITPLGVVTEFSAGITSMGGSSITAGADGNLWLTEGAFRIGRITPSGVVTEFSAGPTDIQLGNITAGPDGNLWFTKRNIIPPSQFFDVGLIGRITPFGAATEFITGITNGALLYNITAGPDGNLWFTEPMAARIGRITTGANCNIDKTTLCLSSGRFKVQAHWATPDGRSGRGQAISLGDDTGYFWFFNASNVEIIVKVLDGCGINGSKWVFAGGLTDVNVVLTVTDAQAGGLTYTNPQNTPFQPIQDTSAFSTCP